MKRLLLALALSMAVLTTTSAGSCDGKKQICEPNAVRQDSYDKSRWWLCSEDGYDERPVIEPTWDAPGVKAKRN